MNNLLITGGCGFIGGNLVRYLLTEADFSGRIVNCDKLTYAGRRESLADIEQAFPERYRFEQVDICERAEVERIFEQYAVDAVCHLAAESHVDRSISGPAPFIRTNIVGTFTLLDCALHAWQGDGKSPASEPTPPINHQASFINPSLPRFHHVSTDEVFGSLGDDGFFTETTPYRPSSPYAASKASADHLVRAYAHTFGLPVTISTRSHHSGPYQVPEKLIPLMILNALQGKPLPVYGRGKNVRDWLYVRDHAVAIWEVMKRGRDGETYNIGGRCEKTNIEVVEQICAILDEVLASDSTTTHNSQLTSPQGLSSRRDLIAFVPDRPGHDLRYAIDCGKIEQELGWAPAETFETGLRKTIQWYLTHKEWWSPLRR